MGITIVILNYYLLYQT